MKHFSRIRYFIKRYPHITNFSLALFTIFFSGLFLEFFFRAALHFLSPKMVDRIHNHISVVTREKTEKNYVSHPYLSYVRNNISYENDGIKIGERAFAKRKNPNAVRVACLGGSTTMYQYPRYLEADLNRYSLGRTFEVMDFGVNGWTLMESTVNYTIRVADFHPDVVLVHHGMNDCFPRVWPDYRPDYSHYRISWRDQSRWFDRKILANSWIFSYLQIKGGAARTALQNYTVRHLDPSDVAYTPESGSISTYRSNLQNLVNLVRSKNAQIIFAPMAYDRDRALKTYEPLIEEHNDCMRDLALDTNVSVADADDLLKKRSDLFLDLVHLKKAGNRIKSIVYASEIMNVFYGLSLKPFSQEALVVIEKSSDFPENCSLEISWNLSVDNVECYHVYVYDDIAKKYLFLGKTNADARQALLWKSDSMQIAERFRLGPAIGRAYRFQIFAILKGEAPMFKGPFTDGIQVKMTYGENMN